MKIINLKGEIVSNDLAEIYRHWGYNVSCPKDFEELANGDEDVEIVINSRGGSVLDASEIYTALKDYKGKVTAKIVGFAGSCASWIAMAADNVKISPMGFIMIHNSSSIAIGDNREMDKSSNMLKTIDNSIRNAYKAKTGLKDEELTELMNNESWFDAKTAVDKNFADEILFDEELTVTNSFLNELELPTDKILNLINKTKEEREEEEVMDLKELQEQHPDLFNEVKNLGKEEGKQEERERIQEIENLAINGFDDLVNKAKFEEPETPEKLAMNILKAQKESGEKVIKDFLEDKDFVVEHDAHEEEVKNTGKDDEFAKLISNFVNETRGVK